VTTVDSSADTDTAVPAGATAIAMDPVVVGRQDPRYGDLVRGVNQRFVGRPDHVVLPSSTRQVRQLVQDAVRAGKRVTARGGGHCYEDFATDPSQQVVIDLSQLRAVYHDPKVRAIAVEAGATLLDLYEGLYKRYGVTLPGGSCPSVGVGGHLAGGGYGPLSRLHGLTVDHLYAVEVVTVDAHGRADTVLATRDEHDPHRDLWWAHTGGGGGNFGIVTRYFLRSPGASRTEPARMLPTPPPELWLVQVAWSWDQLTEAGFHRLIANFASWHEANSAPDSPYAGLFSQLKPAHRSSGSIVLDVQIDASLPDAPRLLDDYLAALNDGVGAQGFVQQRVKLPWLHAAQWMGFFGGDPTVRWKAKSAYLRRGFPADQIAALYRAMTRTDYQHPFAMVMLTSYGGAINTVPPTATAVPSRDSVIKLHYIVFWADPSDDERHIAWIRDLYEDVYAATGGVPVPNELTDGCYVNYADADLSDPARNTSGVPWSTLYYGPNYPRLQRVKKAYDPGNRFRHNQSVELP
jgi:FAD/FMN-containing dehydrogenase